MANLVKIYKKKGADGYETKDDKLVAKVLGFQIACDKDNRILRVPGGKKKVTYTNRYFRTVEQLLEGMLDLIVKKNMGKPVHKELDTMIKQITAIRKEFVKIIGSKDVLKKELLK